MITNFIRKWYRNRFGDLMYKYKPIEGYTPDHLISKYLDNYDSDLTIEMANEFGINLIHLPKTKLGISD